MVKASNDDHALDPQTALAYALGQAWKRSGDSEVLSEVWSAIRLAGGYLLVAADLDEVGQSEALRTYSGNAGTRS